MPSNWLYIDTNFPTFTGEESPNEKITTIQNYLYMLVEQLRYTLRNLGTSNFNAAELAKLGRTVEADEVITQLLQSETVITNLLLSQTVITNELYASYGAIADLTVDTLRTDYRRAQRYLNGDTSDLDYLYIHDEEVSYITASTDGSRTEQLAANGRTFYWTDESKTQMTCTKVTEWPVTVYKYTELVKAKFAFETESSGIKLPVLTLGAGNSDGTNKATIKKGTDGLEIVYISNDDAKEVGLRGTTNGYLDLYGLRRAAHLNFSGWDRGTFTVQLEGKSSETTYGVTLDGNGYPVSILYPDGKSCGIIWE